MKNTLIYGIAIFLLYAFTFTVSNPANYTIDPDFSLTIHGTSNVHDWQSSLESLTGDLSVVVDDEGMLNITSCDVVMPVESIKSEKGSIMDKKTRKAMKASDHPNVKFSLTEFGSVSVDNKQFKTTAKGKLSIAGVSKVIDLDIEGNHMSGRSIEIKAQKDLKMTDFGIEPPVALLGVMKTGDDVTVDFRIKLVMN